MAGHPSEQKNLIHGRESPILTADCFAQLLQRVIGTAEVDVLRLKDNLRAIVASSIASPLPTERYRWS